MTRRRISDRTLLAHCLSRLFDVPHEHQKIMHEDQMISLAERDHFPIPVAEGGSNHFSNVWALTIAEHRAKTRKLDVPGIAKRKRLAERQRRHEATMFAKVMEVAPYIDVSGRARPKRKIASRVNPWPKGRTFQRRQP